MHTLLHLRHDGVTQREESEELLTRFVSGLKCVGQVRVVKFKGFLTIRITAQINWPHVLQNDQYVKVLINIKFSIYYLFKAHFKYFTSDQTLITSVISMGSPVLGSRISPYDCAFIEHLLNDIMF